MGTNELSIQEFSSEEREAVQVLTEGLRGTYGPRYIRAILYGRKIRGAKSSDLDVLLVIREVESPQIEIGRVRRITDPITSQKNILITVIPISETELERRKDSSFFANILQNGFVL